MRHCPHGLGHMGSWRWPSCSLFVGAAGLGAAGKAFDDGNERPSVTGHGNFNKSPAKMSASTTELGWLKMASHEERQQESTG